MQQQIPFYMVPLLEKDPKMAEILTSNRDFIVAGWRTFSEGEDSDDDAVRRSAGARERRQGHR